MNIEGDNNCNGVQIFCFLLTGQLTAAAKKNFSCTFFLIKRYQKIKKEKIYNAFLSFTLIELQCYCDFNC